MKWPDKPGAGEIAWRARRAWAFGWRQFWSMNPPAILATTLLPRAVLQALFFTLLGRYVAGPEQGRFVLIGVPAITLPLLCTIGISELVMVEKWSGTFWRVRLGRIPPFVTFALRAGPYAAAGFTISILALLAAGPIAGWGDIPRHAPALAVVYAVMAVSTCAAGLAGAALAVGRRADVLVGNLLAYLIILAGGAFVPPDRLGVARPLAWLLPDAHGVAAARAVVAGGPWAASLGLEVLVGAGWLAVAGTVVTVQLSRARRLGQDDFS